VNASLELRDVLRLALEKVLELFDFPSGVIRLLAPATGELVLAAHAGLPPPLEVELSATFRVGEGPVGLATQRREPVALEDIATSDFAGSPWAAHGYHTFVAVPLLSRGMLLGSLNIASLEVRPVSETDRDLLEAVAGQIGMAVANAELYTAAQRKIEYLSALHQCSRDVGPAPDLEHVLKLVTARMAGLLRLERAAVAFWERETDQLAIAACHPAGGPYAGLRAPLRTLPLARSVLAEGQAVVSGDPGGEGLLPADFVQAQAIRAALAVPLVAHEERIGMLLGDRGGELLMLSADEMELAMIFANQAAVWIAGARLFVREHQARSAAEAAETRFRGLLESAPDGIVIVDEQGRIALLNTQAEKMFGYERGELLGGPVEGLLPERYRAGHEPFRTAYVSRPRTRPMGAGLDLLARHRDGSEFPVEISLSPLRTPEGLLVTSVIRDVTDRKQQQDALARQAQELARSNAELEQFAYVASHDLQEPLRMVASYTQLLARRYRGKLDADADEFIAFAVDGVNRMQALINDLLAYSRLRTKGAEFAPTDCSVVLDEALANLQAAISESGGVVTRGDLPTVVADRRQLMQLFQNLVGNAIKFHGETAPRVEVSARLRDAGGETDGGRRTEDDGSASSVLRPPSSISNPQSAIRNPQWEFAVRDNGIGIDPEHQERIFLIFQRLHSRAEYPGTGIGLAICKRIVERHGGRIWVQSAPGEGTTFFFTLPKGAMPQ
jgi:PAS domain S-box-containing protein